MIKNGSLFCPCIFQYILIKHRPVRHQRIFVAVSADEWQQLEVQFLRIEIRSLHHHIPRTICGCPA